MFTPRQIVNGGLSLADADNRRDAPGLRLETAALGPAEGDGPDKLARPGPGRLHYAVGAAVLAHIALLGVFQFGLSFTVHIDDTETRVIPVEVVNIDDITRPQEQRVVAEAPRPPPPPLPPTPPAPAAAETPPAAIAPPPVAPPEPLVAALPPPVPAPAPVPVPAPPVAQPRPTPPPVAKPAPPSPVLARAQPKPKPKAPPPPRDFDVLLRDLATRPERPQGEVAPAPREGAARAEPNASPKPTATEIDGMVEIVRRKIEKCWNPPVGAADAGQLVVRLAVSVDPDGTVRGATVLSDSSRPETPYLQAAAESARRAVLNRECNPLPLPRDRYELWKELELSFNPKELLGR
ncbi:MAG: hypothetical protein EXQ88_03090 [Alphaproteobacteria bacterium]|nr:hypothetical protein [Alphaproteobacteria bacterium]